MERSGRRLFSMRCLVITDAMQISSASQLNQVIFRDKASVSVGRKFFSLFPGLGYAAGYKVSPLLAMKSALCNCADD
jgi:hypothetical protein